MKAEINYCIVKHGDKGKSGKIRDVQKPDLLKQANVAGTLLKRCLCVSTDKLERMIVLFSAQKGKENHTPQDV